MHVINKINRMFYDLYTFVTSKKRVIQCYVSVTLNLIECNLVFIMHCKMQL